ncbi:hypothetical protein P43SY_000355 [Pythium insidiosum]|uniref:HSF-type DNA-binding domain-containing protein n=1 Tax=Pythium insidiosum TaxID=114742 RepID=A0AAD5Q369_PYTIN|nr:hypothetical protein P43SY_000355 [Pythium insidiosum]
MRMRSASYPSNTCTTPNAEMFPATKKPVAATRVPKFLRCLYDILHNEDQSILSWSKDGTHFQIYDIKRLEIEVLPKYFKHGKFASFQRQLNNFGFRKWTKTQSNVCTFSHHHYVSRHPQHLVDLVIQLNETINTNVAAKQPSHGLSGKRKRAESDATVKSAKQPKCERTSPQPVPTIKVEESAFDLEVASWSLMADISPLEWAAKSHGMCKLESGNETPTSAAGFIDMGFDFTMEELDDILLTTSQEPSGSRTQAQPCIAHASMPVMTWESELFGKNELELYMQESELWSVS